MRVLLLLSLILSPSFAWAGIDDPKAFSNEIMTLILKGDFDKADEKIDSAFPTPERVLSTIKESYKELGSPLFIDMLHEEMLGTSVLESIYLARWEKKALVFRFRFIRGKDGWFIWSLKYSNEGEKVLWPGSG